MNEPVDDLAGLRMATKESVAVVERVAEFGELFLE